MVATTPIFKTRENAIEPFLVPTFRVEVGASLSSLQPVWDVERVSYKDSVNQIDSFELTLANSGWNRTTPLHTATVTPASPRDLLVMPGAHVRLWMGYRTQLDLFPMLTGRITSVSPSFGDGGVKLTVRALSSLDALRSTPKNYKWTPQRGKSVIKDHEIATQIARKATQELGSPVQAVIPRGLDQAEAGEPSVTQANVTDIAFLIQRAKRRGYIVCFRENLPPRSASGEAQSRRAGGEPQKFIYFGPSNLLQDQEALRLGERAQRFELGWGQTLLDFRPTLNLSTTLWGKVKLSFWNRRTRKQIKVEYKLEDLWRDEHGINKDLEPLIRLAPLGENEVSQVPVHTEGQARDLARNTLRDNFLQLVTADGSCVGMPEIRACSRIEVTEVGAPFSGTYFVTGTTHSIDDNGYRTQFSGRREQLTS